MKKLGLLFVCLALTHASWAQLVTFAAHLTGSQENPPNSSLGVGDAWATLDLSTDAFVFHDSWSGLSAPDTATHIHAPAPPGTNAPVIIPFGVANGFIAGLTFGTVDYSGTLTATQASQLLDGLFYANVHTTAFPGGEIRGQLVPVPEPSTYALLGTVLLGAVVGVRNFKRRRKKA